MMMRTSINTFIVRRCFASNPAAAASSASAAAKAAKKGESGDNRFSLLRKTMEPMEYTESRTPEQFAQDAQDAKAYARARSAAYMARRREEAVKMRLQAAAIEALPQELRGAALKVDTTAFPANRHVFTLTPPIPGFREEL